MKERVSILLTNQKLNKTKRITNDMKIKIKNLREGRAENQRLVCQMKSVHTTTSSRQIATICVLAHADFSE